jgi:hypothetical protein
MQFPFGEINEIKKKSAENPSLGESVTAFFSSTVQLNVAR